VEGKLDTEPMKLLYVLLNNAYYIIWLQRFFSDGTVYVKYANNIEVFKAFVRAHDMVLSLKTTTATAN